MAVNKAPNWQAWQLMHAGSHLDRSQIRFTIMTPLPVKSWKRHCKDREFVRETAKLDPHTNDYLITPGDIRLDDVDYKVDLCLMGVWVPITKDDLIRNLEGYSFTFKRAQSNKSRRMYVSGGQVHYLEPSVGNADEAPLSVGS